MRPRERLKKEFGASGDAPSDLTSSVCDLVALKLEALNKWGRSSEGERWNRTPEVAGSNPAASTISTSEISSKLIASLPLGSNHVPIVT